MEEEIKRYTEELFNEIFGNGQGTLDEFDWEDITQTIEKTAHHFANWQKERQSHWKPSEEQMKWLKDILETVPMTCRQQVPLESLYNDLLKLANDCINTYHRTFIQEL